MKTNQIYSGNCKLNFDDLKVEGDQVFIDNESYYKISNHHLMRPFFMSIVSDSNHWMFISSNGGLTAGRKNSESSLFPYYTDDKITESVEVTGSKTILRIQTENKNLLWEPFSEKYEGIYAINRNLYKNLYGNKIIFEEVNQDLGLTYRYEWNTSNRFGFIKRGTLVNQSKHKIQVKVIDGIQNILPYGVNTDLQNGRSNLVDAYKKSELEANIGLGIYTLSAIIVDKAEPSEALKANIVYSLGLDKPKYLISSLQLNAFRKGITPKQEIDKKAEKGAYLVCTELTLMHAAEKTWMIVANVNQGPSDVSNISSKLKYPDDLSKEIVMDIELGSQNLLELTGAADGLQISNDDLRTSRHYSNVLYNIMRGGIFDKNYDIEKEDFLKYIAKANRLVFKNNLKTLESLPTKFSLKTLKKVAEKKEDNNFKRLCLEYMPLKFSRRHGDPSRPWNKFSINTQSEIDGSKILDYEGNWRDIFQNWEALAHAYPEFIESMIHKFLNATTFDGYNPYRVTKDGFDWEVIEENDPWSYIGYWGDHQIIYLLKFLEFMENYYPNKLSNYLDQELFVYANVPYKIKSYEEILKNPKDTIEFDNELNEKLIQQKLELGADGALLSDENSCFYKVNLIEKLLATVLAKCANFIPEGGIWLNTQRPEWNDANNALVGNGVSMVTLYYLRRFFNFLRGLITDSSFDQVNVSEEMFTFFKGIAITLDKYQGSLKEKISDQQRKLILDGLGNAGSKYRMTIYEKGFTGSKDSISKNELMEFIETVIIYLDHSIKTNKRSDNLYHAYNLMSVDNNNEISISYLSEMLEGQVAVLSSGFLSANESLELLDNLKKSALFREDQYSYLLYPNKELPRFIDKNNIPEVEINRSELLKTLLKNGNTQIIEKDITGKYHFNGSFNNANSLRKAFSELPVETYAKLIKQDEALILNIFEDIFDHKSFTGRSGTFFGYEGLGSIYWHMVSKLLLAVQECCLRAIDLNEDEEIIGRFIEHYYEINEGIGVHKSPELYGAFPTDPYSHTPAHKGAQQPGMTGQVKEDILSRIGELGVTVKNGILKFNPRLLRLNEFLKEKRAFTYTDVNGFKNEIQLQKNSLCFTYCQIPIIYKLAAHEGIEIIFDNKPSITIDSLSVNQKISKNIFERTGEVEQLIVSLNQKIIK